MLHFKMALLLRNDQSWRELTTTCSEGGKAKVSKVAGPASGVLAEAIVDEGDPLPTPYHRHWKQA